MNAKLFPKSTGSGVQKKFLLKFFSTAFDNEAHYALELFLCQAYSTTQPHRRDYGRGHLPCNLGRDTPSLSQDNENSTLRIWRGSAKRSGPKSLLRCVRSEERRVGRECRSRCS